MGEDVVDLAMKERIAAAGEPDRSQAVLRHLIDQLSRLLDGDLLFGAQVLLVAEVAGHVAAIGEVELGVDRPLRRRVGDDGIDDLALALARHFCPPVSSSHDFVSANGRVLRAFRVSHSPSGT